jgi:tetratricopeptide (TPR) repeat protein
MLKLIVLTLAAAIPARAQEPRLGTINFPTSAGPAAQGAFVRGVLYLHSFEYASAATAFREAQALEPGFAMAYWGEVMTLNHPVWNQQDSVQARTVLGRLAPTPEARQANAPTARERGYLQAVEQLYGAGGSKQRRDTLYSAAMGSLAAAYPSDAEAQSFFALSLLGLSQGDRVVPTYMRAGAISLALMQQYPDHPGAAHYAIHSFDDPDHAIIGLPAARAYSQIAPGAPHAQHMTAHIFLALGMWNDVVSQNIIASGPDSSKWTPGHYTQWLQYGLLQLGRAPAADSLLRSTLAHAGTQLQGGRSSYALEMRAAQIVNARQWREPYLFAPLAVSRTLVGSEAADAFAQGYAALQRDEPGIAAAEQARFPALKARVASRPDATQPGTVDAMAKALDAAIAFQAGHRDEALVLIAEANRIEDGLVVEFGPPTIVKPTWELRGEMLLAMNRPREAHDAFARSLALQPNRLLSVQGLAAAERAMTTTGHSGE